MDRVPMTAGGYDRLTEELRHLKSVVRPSIIKALEVAREALAARAAPSR